MREIVRHGAKSEPHTLDLNNERCVTDIGKIRNFCLSGGVEYRISIT